ncbi:hypothetical protein C8F04DRAFT_1188083 [Mycena alexandri]|uniref:Uncharacterized protein n=1 Tax=Mycena alexandri TaxID=1745969 RepID=A0AAD6SJ65_9AGAR|nr:hypothetical protein C8F04DRAFT_1188083 [Mycena alexandri]
MEIVKGNQYFGLNCLQEQRWIITYAADVVREVLESTEQKGVRRVWVVKFSRRENASPEVHGKQIPYNFATMREGGPSKSYEDRFMESKNEYRKIGGTGLKTWRPISGTLRTQRPDPGPKYVLAVVVVADLEVDVWLRSLNPVVLVGGCEFISVVGKGLFRIPGP